MENSVLGLFSYPAFGTSTNLVAICHRMIIIVLLFRKELTDHQDSEELSRTSGGGRASGGAVTCGLFVLRCKVEARIVAT
jgi:hypothetical protein